MHDAQATAEEARAPRPAGVRLRLRHLVVAGVAIALLSATTTAFAAHQFDDVPNTHNFHDEIDWMADTNITGGFPDGTFRPGDPVTRGQMSAFMLRLYNLQAGLTSVDGGTDGGSVGGTANIDVWETVNNLSTQVVIPPGTTGRIVATFSTELFCNGGNNYGFLPLFAPQCQFRFMIDPAGAPPASQMSPGAYSVFPSLDADLETDILLQSSSHTIQGFTGVLNPGTYTVTVQMMANDADNNGEPADDSLSLTIGQHVLTTEVHPADRVLS